MVIAVLEFKVYVTCSRQLYPELELAVVFQIFRFLFVVSMLLEKLCTVYFCTTLLRLAYGNILILSVTYVDIEMAAFKCWNNTNRLLPLLGRDGYGYC